MIKALLLLIIATFVWGYQLPLDGDVIVLNDNTINVAIKQYDFLLVEFYASWCGHCKEFAPEYAQFATDIKKSGLQVNIAKLDGGDQKQAMNKYKVTSFPTLILLIKGHPVPFKGDRSAKALTEFLTTSLASRIQRLGEIDDVYKFISDNTIASIYFAESQNDQGLKVYDTVSKMFPHIKFGYTDAAYPRKLYDVDAGALILFKNFEDRRSEFVGKFTELKLAEFIIEKSTPSFEEIDSKNFQTIFGKHSPSIILLYNNANADTKDALRVLAPHVKQRLTIVSIHQDNQLLTQVLNGLLVKEPTYPSVYYYKNANLVYQLQEQITVENIMRLVHKGNAGTIPKKVKSQPVPKTQSQLLKLVGDNFEQLVKKSDKDVLVQFCPQLNNECLWQEYDNLAKELKGTQSLSLGYIEMSENEVEGINIEKYPAFYLYRRNLSTNPVIFSGEVSVEGLKQFLRENVNIVELKNEL